MKPFYRVLTYLALFIQSLIILGLLAERKMTTGTQATTLCRQEHNAPKACSFRQGHVQLPVSSSGLLISGIKPVAR